MTIKELFIKLFTPKPCACSVEFEKKLQEKKTNNSPEIKTTETKPNCRCSGKCG